MRIEHEIHNFGNLKKIIAKVFDDKKNPVDAEISIIVKAPDGFEIIYLPPDTNEVAENSIYAGGAQTNLNTVSRKGKGVYEVVYPPSAKGEHEVVIVIMGDEKIDDYRFSFNNHS